LATLALSSSRTPLDMQLLWQWGLTAAHHRADVALAGDAAESARALVAEIGRREYQGFGWRTPELAERNRSGPLADDSV
jgi:hypothetical protein